MQKKEFYDLTNPQKSIWYTEEVFKGTTINNICTSGIIYEKIDIELLKKAINLVVKQNDSFRLRVVLQNGMVKQYISDFKNFDIDVEFIEKEAQLKNIEEEAAKYSFNIIDSDLFRFKIVILNDVFACVILTANHIISDSWSLGITIQEILRNYHSLQNKENIDFKSFSYVDFINSEIVYKQSDKYKKDKDYWQKIFDTIPEQSTIPSISKRDTKLHNNANRLSYDIDKGLKNKIVAFCKENHISMFNFFMAIFSIYISRVSNSKDFVIGTPILNRTNVKEKHTTGMFVNTAPIRINNFPENFIDFANTISNKMMGILRHQKYSYNSILEDLRENFGNIPSLYNIMISYQVTKAFDKNYGNYSTNWTFNNYCANDLDIHIYDINDTGILSISYDFLISKYNQNDIQILHEHIVYMITQVLSCSNILINNIDIITKKEKEHLLYTFNNTTSNYPKEKTIVDLFEKQVKKFPLNTALLFQNEKISYKTLNEKANRFAHFLKQKNIKNTDKIAILLDKNIDLIVAILGILKIGSCYIPISPEYPEDRIKQILTDSKSKLLVTSKNFDIKFENHICVEDLDLSKYKSDNINNSSPNNLAYIIFTSGSTGVPKGVTISHSSLLNYIYWANKYYCNNKPTNFPLYSSIGFDLTITSIFTPLINGGTIIIYKDSDILLTLKDIFKNSISDIVKLTPAHLSLINTFDFDNTNVKKLIVGGDLLSPEICKRITNKFKNIEIYNEYGPTETTVGCMIYQYNENIDVYGSVLIGKPIDNTAIYVLDNNLNPVPLGCPGELYISGDGLSKGYLNRQDLTNKAFIPNPFISKTSMYKTGDIATFVDKSNIICVGRSDNQIKIRGFRIELGEIEDKIHDIPQINSCVVIKKSNLQLHDYLCAYYTSNEHIDSSVIKQHLSKYLPKYMIPSFFIQMESLPFTTNGKIDRKKLPDPDTININKNIVLPRNKIDSTLISILQDLLNVSNISIDDDFFEIGGDSLTAINLCARVQSDLHVELLVKDVLDNSTIKDISDIIQSGSSTTVNIKPIAKSEYYELSASQRRIYLVSQISGKDSILYNTPGGIILEGSIDIEKLNDCFNTMIQRHESLRTYFDTVEEKVVQKVQTNVSFKLDVLNNVNFDEIDFLFNEFVKPFDLSKAPLFRAKLIIFTNGKTALFIDMHHIISDGTSLAIFTDELIKLYNDEHLPNLSITYKDFAYYEYNKLKSGKLKEAEKYWVNQFTGEIPVLNLPTNYPRPGIKDYIGKKKHFTIDYTTTKKIDNYCKNEGITPYMLLLACYYILLSKYSSQNDIVIGSPIIGRDIAETYNIIGAFINTLALRNTVDDTLCFKNFVHNIKHNLIDAYKYQTYPFDELVNKLNIKRDTSRSPLFDTMFIYQNNGYTNLKFNNIPAEYYLPDTVISKFDLSLEAIPFKGQIALSFEYATSLFNDDFIENLASHYLNILDIVLNNDNIQLSDICMLSKEEKNNILYKFNYTKFDYPDDKTIAELFESQVEKSPNNIAVVFGNKSLTYKQLNDKANSLAFYLRNVEKIKANDYVGIMCSRSFEMIICILAVLKAGGAYIPIDPTYPQDRINYMLESSNAKILLTQNRLDNKVNYKNKVFIDLNYKKIYNLPSNNIDKINTSNDLAYVIFTSGSTGKPKGVMLKQKNIVNFIYGMMKEFKFSSSDTIACITTVSFDIFVLESLMPLLNGLKVVIASEDEQTNVKLFNELCIKNNINIIQSTPSRIESFMLNKDYLNFIKNATHILIGGEPFPSQLKKAIKEISPCQIYNMYGPTETAVWSTLGNLTDTNEISIGHPIINTQVYILDKNLNPLPIGVPGEIYISGDGVSNGYLNNINQTNKCFISNPFVNNTLMYNTGDLGFWNNDGSLNCIGRIDNQIKIRGLRIELGEIESVILKFPHIKKTCIIKQTIENKKFITAYYTTDKVISKNELRKFLLKSLPRYMVPSYFVPLSKFPYTPNGKIDKKALPLPSEILNFNKEEYVAPSTDLQRQLVNIYEKVLNTKPIGINDNFFELGGDSLLAMNLNIEILKISSNIQYSDIFRFPTIAELEEKIMATDNTPLFSKIENLSGNFTDILKNSTKKAKIKKWHPRSVLITGSTGFLGIHVLEQFIKNEKCNIYCIVREEAGITAKTKLYQKLNYYFGNKYDHLIDKRVFALTGNISEPAFGLNQEEILNLASSIDVVINCAANVSHFGKYNDFYNTNVKSIKYMIDFCKSFNKKLYHISTMSVSGIKLDKSLPVQNVNSKIMFKESSLYVGQILENVYVRSKFEAETYMLDAISSGVDGYILRMGNLMPRFKDGFFQENIFTNAFINKICAFFKIGEIPDYILKEPIELTPIDYAAKATYKLITHPNSVNRIFHIYNHNYTSTEKLLNRALKTNFDMKIVDEQSFKSKVNTIIQDNDPNKILEFLLNDFDKDLHLDYKFDIINTSNFTIKYLKKTFFVWPKVSNKYLNKFLNLLRRMI